VFVIVNSVNWGLLTECYQYRTQCREIDYIEPFEIGIRYCNPFSNGSTTKKISPGKKLIGFNDNVPLKTKTAKLGE